MGGLHLHYAARYNNQLIIEDLIEADKSVAYVADKNANRTALHIAASRGMIEVYKERTYKIMFRLL